MRLIADGGAPAFAAAPGISIFSISERKPILIALSRFQAKKKGSAERSPFPIK
jgi:hypothetical protein